MIGFLKVPNQLQHTHTHTHNRDYRPYFNRLPGLSHNRDNTLFWSRTPELVKLLSCMCATGANVMSSANIPSTAIINGDEESVGTDELRWCGTTDLSSSPGMNIVNLALYIITLRNLMGGSFSSSQYFRVCMCVILISIALASPGTLLTTQYHKN